MSKTDQSLYVTSGIAAAAVLIIGFLGYQYYTQSNEIDMLLEERNFFLNESTDSKTALNEATSTILALETELEDLKEDLEDLADDYKDERNRNEEFEDEIRDLAGTLGDLDKLANTDEELLQKYSKVYFLNENYAPERLKKIDDDYILDGRDDQYFHSEAIDRLEDLLKDAERDDIELKVVSAYRSFDEQNAIKNTFTQIYGSGANTFSADQGFSEHQLGTAVDFTNPEVGALVQSFAQTDAYEWLLDNAYKHGFILSYPEGNDFYIFEPWHWRFVGEDLARDLERSNETFYTMDQREIDEYLLTLFD